MDDKEIIQDIRDRIIRLEVTLDTLVCVKIKSSDEQIKEIKANLTWVWRSVASALFMALGTIFITLIKK